MVGPPWAHSGITVGTLLANLSRLCVCPGIRSGPGVRRGAPSRQARGYPSTSHAPATLSDLPMTLRVGRERVGHTGAIQSTEQRASTMNAAKQGKPRRNLYYHSRLTRAVPESAQHVIPPTAGLIPGGSIRQHDAEALQTASVTGERHSTPDRV